MQVDQVTDRLKLDLAIKDAQPPISMFNINTLFWVLSYKKLRYTFSKSSLMHFGSKKSIFILWKGKLGNLSQFLSINALKNWPLSKFCSTKIHLAMFGRNEGISDRFLSKVWKRSIIWAKMLRTAFGETVLSQLSFILFW